MGPREVSALTILAECPFMDIQTFGDTFNPSASSSYSRVLLSRLKKEELVETLEGYSLGVLHRKVVRLTHKGRAFIDHHYALKKQRGLSQVDEVPEGNLFFPHRLPTFRNAYENPGRTHFNRTDLTRLWMQLRCARPTKMSVLWDFVKLPESIPLLGNPDLVLFNGIDLEAGHLKKLTLIEWEFGEKPGHIIFERIDELTRNPELLFLVVVSPHDYILKNWANIIRKNVPGSSAYTGKRQFHSQFLNEQHHLTKVFMMQWNPSDSPVHGSKIEDAKCMRFDHESFDLLSSTLRVQDGKKVRDRIQFNRHRGRQEVTFGDLVRFMNG